MRIRALAAVTMLLALGCAACQSNRDVAAPVGTAVGDLVGGAAWLGMKGAGLAAKGGVAAAKATGKTVTTVVHQQFPGSSAPPAQAAASSKPAQVSQTSQSQGAALAY